MVRVGVPIWTWGPKTPTKNVQDITTKIYRHTEGIMGSLVKIKFWGLDPFLGAPPPIFFRHTAIKIFGLIELGLANMGKIKF